jgi:hypothetical protein
MQWYYTKDGQRHGPVAAAELKQLADHGELVAEALVWREGMDDWVPARKVKGLFEGDGKADASAKSGVGLKEEAAAEDPAEPPVVNPPSSPPAPLPQAVEGNLETAARSDISRGDSPEATRPPAQPRPSGVSRETPSRGTIAAFERSTAAVQRARERTGGHLFDFVLELARGQFTAPFVHATTRLFGLAAHYGLYVAMLALLVHHVVQAVKTGPPLLVLLGVGEVFGLALLQYSGSRFLASLERLTLATPAKVASTAFLDCFALLNLLAGLAALLGFSVLAVQADDPNWAFPAAAVFILCEYATIVALNPETLHLSIAPRARPAEEALGLLSFFVKLGVRAVPVCVGLGVAYGLVQLGRASWAMLSPAPASAAPGLVGDWAGLGSLLQFHSTLAGPQSTFPAVTTLFTAAALPIVAYLVFLSYFVMVEVLGALLVLPQKLDAARRDQETPPED